MRFLKTNTATRVTVGPFLDRTDGITPETALTVTSCKLTLMVDTGGVPTLVLDTNPTASGGANDMVHVTGDDAGFYDLELAAANVNYVGSAMLALTDAATHCPVFHEFTILPAAVYDSLIGGTDTLPADVTQWNGTAVPTSSVGGPGVIRRGTTSTHSASTITLAAESAPGLNFFAGATVRIISGTGIDQARTVASSTNANPPVLTLSRNWAVTPSGSITYEVIDGELGTTLAEINAEVDTAIADAAIPTTTLTTAMTESYAADGATMTLAQGIYFLTQMLSEAAVSGTTMTIKKLDGTTTAYTLTLGDATNPTTVTRAT